MTVNESASASASSRNVYAVPIAPWTSTRTGPPPSRSNPILVPSADATEWTVGVVSAAVVDSILGYYHYGIIWRNVKQKPNRRMSHEEAVPQIAELLARLIGEAILFNESVAAALGVSAVDLQTFGVITRHDGATTPTEVSAQTGLPASTVTRVLDRLEQRGFITRSSVPSDRRKIAVEVVESKAAEVAQHYAGKLGEIERLNARRTRAEVAAVVAYLSDLATDEDA